MLSIQGCAAVALVQVSAAQAWGATGVVVMNDRVGEAELVMGGSPSRPITIPSMLVGYQNGLQLKSLERTSSTYLTLPVSTINSPRLYALYPRAMHVQPALAMHGGPRVVAACGT